MVYDDISIALYVTGNWTQRTFETGPSKINTGL